MLKIDNLTKSFDGLQVLKGISLEVKKGETVAIIGRSGSGKSTLIRCLNDLEKANGGSIEVDHEKMLDHGVYSPAPQMRRICLKMGYVFQNFNLFPHLSVLQNISEAQKCVLKRDKARADAYTRELLKKVGLSDKENAYPCQLSGGQQQRVAIARALALDPELLCFDEPTSALDPQLTQEVLNVLRSLRKENRTMLIVTHEMDFAREAADRVIYIEDGVICAQGKPEEVFAHEAVRRFTTPLTDQAEEA